MLRVKDIMETQVVTVRPDLSLSDLQDVLLERRVHGAPVVEGGKVVGIISRSDVVRQLKVEEERIAASAYLLEPYDADDLTLSAQNQAIEAAAQRLSQLHVRDMMIRDVAMIGPDAPLEELARCMLERRIQRVLVTEGPSLLGIVSVTDLVELFASGRVTAS